MIPVAMRVKKHREMLRKAGLRPIQIWVPDTRAIGFDDECRRQAQLVAQADAQDSTLTSFLEEAASDLDGWEA